MKRWTQIFKALANINRIRVIVLLSDGKERTVTEISEIIHISLRAMSRHLVLLHNLDVLDNAGKDGHVFYRLNKSVPVDIYNAVSLFLSKK